MTEACPRSPTGRGASLKTKRLGIRIPWRALIFKRLYMPNLNGYSDIFKFHKNAALNVDPSKSYSEFKSHPELYNFIIAVNQNPDSPSLQQAISINPLTAFELIQKGGSRAGGYFGCIDVVECRHILMLAFLKNYIGDKSLGNVLEIGGGYGNFVRLATNIFKWEDWCIIDLEYISQLQKWFLGTEKISLDRVHFMSEDHLQPYIADTIIGTHSLSEFDMDTFINYYERYIQRAQRLFYVSHVSMPSPELLKLKFDMIRADFELLTTQGYENHQSMMYIFEHK